MTFTVLGASGFIGGSLVASLRAAGEHVVAPARDASSWEGDLGDVIYCIGLTADFRSRPFDTVDAHVQRLSSVLKRGNFSSVLYLSSTRVYARGTSPALEDGTRGVDPGDPSDLYNLSKLMGESLGLSSTKTFRVARLSNVYGYQPESTTFLSSILTDAIRQRAIELQTSRDSFKDYVSIRDVVRVLPRIARHGRHRIYNVASGCDVTAGALLDRISSVTGCSTSVREGAPTIVFPSISIERLRSEFDHHPSSVLDDIQDLVNEYERHERRG